MPNVNVPNLSSRIEARISAEVKYASLFWSYHLRETGHDNEISVELKELMYNKFLYWLEVLSLLNKVAIANESLEITRDCIEVSGIKV